jgi:hypothetical protein
MVDTADLKSSISNGVWVRVPLSAPNNKIRNNLKLSLRGTKRSKNPIYCHLEYSERSCIVGYKSSNLLDCRASLAMTRQSNKPAGIF